MQFDNLWTSLIVTPVFYWIAVVFFKAEVLEVLLQLDTMFLREIFHSHSIIINNLSLGMSSIFGLLAKQVRKIPGFFLCMKLTLSSGEETPITSIKSDAHLQWGQIISALQIY